MEHFESWKDLVNPEFYIKLGGYWLVLFIIFAETGLFVGFFLPGDSLLFISGIYAVTMVKDTFGITGSDLLDTTIIASSIALEIWLVTGLEEEVEIVFIIEKILSSLRKNTCKKLTISMKLTELWL